ncbi:MAG: hypothetical protein ACK4Q5_04150 [Saprospiraceae bacterium]
MTFFADRAESRTVENREGPGFSNSMRLRGIEPGIEPGASCRPVFLTASNSRRLKKRGDKPKTVAANRLEKSGLARQKLCFQP